MATRPKVPKYDVPLVGPDGRMNQDWYRAFSQFTQAGEFATTVGAAGAADAPPATPTGYIAVFVTIGGVSVPKQIAFYDPA